MRFLRLLSCICCLLPAPSNASDPIQLRVLYSGNPGSDRMTDFELFLKQNFSEVTVTDTSTFTESEAENFDVVIFDWTRTQDETGRLRREWRIENPPRLSKEFSRPAMLIGETGGRVTSELKLKLDWLCLCMYDSAHHLKLSHPIFHDPLQVAPELQSAATPEEYPYQSIEPLGPTMSVWKVQTVNYPLADVGLSHTLYGFEDSPDAEVFARGLSMKGPDCVALSRQANYFHWGFSVSPSQMTDSAQRLFVNAIVYIRKFDRKQPLIRKSAAPREWAIINAKLPELLTEEYRQLKSEQIRNEITASPGLLPDRYMGQVDQFIHDQLKWVEPEMVRVLPEELHHKFGTDAARWQAYYRSNLEYLRPGEQYSTFVVDSDVASLKISNRDTKLLEHCLDLLESQRDVDLAQRILQRYTSLNFETPEQWRSWYAEHKDRLFFSDSGGYQFRISPERID